MSIGSVGGRDDNTVSDITFSNNEVKSSVNGEYVIRLEWTATNHRSGIRIKASEGDTGTISGVTYKSTALSGISGYAPLLSLHNRT